MMVKRPEGEGTRIFVGGLQHDMTRKEFTNLFGIFGEIIDVWLARHPPGFGFVRYKNRSDAEEACKTMHEKVIDGKPIGVMLAQTTTFRNKEKLHHFYEERRAHDVTYDVPNEQRLQRLYPAGFQEQFPVMEPKGPLEAHARHFVSIELGPERLRGRYAVPLGSPYSFRGGYLAQPRQAARPCPVPSWFAQGTTAQLSGPIAPGVNPSWPFPTFAVLPSSYAGMAGVPPPVHLPPVAAKYLTQETYAETACVQYSASAGTCPQHDPAGYGRYD